ncbi:2-hydroxy-3-oxopropionate reductase [marine bacterium AO1-C]|nr:2-hydroxy-3-oxopropionate reductase [marine bacterium AO1-C]
MKVTFIGLGIMGSRMAKNLLKNKVEITVYNRTRSVAETLEPLGAKVASSSAEAVQNADIVFTMLSAPTVVEAVAFGAQGFLQHMKANALWIDCSTVSPAFSLQSAEEAQKHQINFVGAPVAGTKPHAENAELVFFCGGEATLVDQAKPYMEMMGKKVVHLGGVSKGSSLKILVNYILAQGMLAFAEAAVVGEKIGLDRSFLLDFLPNLPVSAPFLKSKAEKLAKNDDDVQFPLELMHKDVGLFASTAEAHGITNLSADASKDLYQKAIEAGLGRNDFSAIYNALLNRFLETEAVK